MKGKWWINPFVQYRLSLLPSFCWEKDKNWCNASTFNNRYADSTNHSGLLMLIFRQNCSNNLISWGIFKLLPARDKNACLVLLFVFNLKVKVLLCSCEGTVSLFLCLMCVFTGICALQACAAQSAFINPSKQHDDSSESDRPFNGSVWGDFSRRFAKCVQLRGCGGFSGELLSDPNELEETAVLRLQSARRPIICQHLSKSAVAVPSGAFKRRACCPAPVFYSPRSCDEKGVTMAQIQGMIHFKEGLWMT